MIKDEYNIKIADIINDYEEIKYPSEVYVRINSLLKKVIKLEKAKWEKERKELEQKGW